jgi:hypothetical protein
MLSKAKPRKARPLNSVCEGLWVSENAFLEYLKISFFIAKILTLNKVALIDGIGGQIDYVYSKGSLYIREKFFPHNMET